MPGDSNRAGLVRASVLHQQQPSLSTANGRNVVGPLADWLTHGSLPLFSRLHQVPPSKQTGRTRATGVPVRMSETTGGSAIPFPGWCRRWRRFRQFESPKTKSAEVTLDALVPVRAVLRSFAGRCLAALGQHVALPGLSKLRELPGSHRPAPQGTSCWIRPRPVSSVFLVRGRAPIAQAVRALVDSKEHLFILHRTGVESRRGRFLVRPHPHRAGRPRDEPRGAALHDGRPVEGACARVV